MNQSAAQTTKSDTARLAIDFLLLVNSYGDKVINIEDSCGGTHFGHHSGWRDRALSPETVWSQQGGGEAVDNLFWSEEHAQDWLKDYPQYAKLSQTSIHELMEHSKSRAQ